MTATATATQKKRKTRTAEKARKRMTKKETMKSAIPRAGIEFDYLDKLTNTSEVEVVYFRAGKKVKCKGFVMSVKESFSMSGPASLDID